ncbi:hypothetical protein CU633_14425 [Bacillus sp. V3-13]|uniref:competence protein ComK n=1 Tax=Bacillus sp. V3-13 TaxID=2053728 RepID=UPI000C767164|nr:competence protein ComK [Bacillus sp. V3-13]PLR76746.1 hypothetical protein CU633_14425 [Bacillus sp. V3-13]
MLEVGNTNFKLVYPICQKKRINNHVRENSNVNGRPLNINPKLNLLNGERDGYGKLCTRVWERGDSFLVDLDPLKVLDESLKYMNSNLKGAIKSAKLIIGMCLAVNPYHGIFMFPVKGPSNDDCFWINAAAVQNTSPSGRQTKVVFHDGYSIKEESRFTAFNNKLLIARNLGEITKERISIRKSYLWRLKDPRRSSRKTTAVIISSLLKQSTTNKICSGSYLVRTI